MPSAGKTSGSPVVLGLCSGTHDSSAALIGDGRLIGLVEEERLNGVKHTNAYPEQAVDWLLQRAALTPGAVTHVAYNFDPRRYLAAAPLAVPYLLLPSTARRALPRAHSFARVHRNGRARFRQFRERFPSARVVGVEHHRAHAMYALAAGLDGRDEDPGDSAVLVVDSLGERVTTSISRARCTPLGVELRRVCNIGDPASLGYVYGAVTEHLGWRRGDEEGTVMALAALGDPGRFRTLFARAIPIGPGNFALDTYLFPLRVLSHRWPRVSSTFIAATCPPRSASDPVEQIHMDLAAALQERVEQVMVHLARHARETTGAKHLAVSGGVAMNCVAIGRICEEAGFAKVVVPPAPGDSGTSAGAALAVVHRLTGQLPAGAGSCYLGPGYPGLELSSRPRRGLTAVRLASPAATIAARLAKGHIIGLFQGRLEAGPRALGNRSILASPLDPGVVDRLNMTVKYREPFRPFAPIVLADRASEYFTLRQPSPYMSIASRVTARAAQALPAVVHVNGTARIQTVTPEQNPFLAEVLAAFAAITGHPLLINTSLNIKGKPICGTPDAALDCLTESGLDALLIENWWVTKEPAAEPATEAESTS
ncbi:carbamoyltransferase family protein [Actinomadura fibrosa]|uniref:Carbamoyltransferase n=1 Tax=Actinomadura fibrosa TaxID=111802 RepID=A0ABW2XCI2_9ACTN|nr:carbamoyltransferase C-terminal domain-containing protein [Actinomadura fibrosa]